MKDTTMRCSRTVLAACITAAIAFPVSAANYSQAPDLAA